MFICCTCCTCCTCSIGCTCSMFICGCTCSICSIGSICSGSNMISFAFFSSSDKPICALIERSCFIGIVASGTSLIYAGTTTSGNSNSGSSFTTSLDTPEYSNWFNLFIPLVVTYRIVKLRYVSCSCVRSLVEYGISTCTILDLGRPSGGSISKLFTLSPANRTGPSHNAHIAILSVGL